jgi:RsiW-degrading membrane proteinase PrsW (M82 family)
MIAGIDVISMIEAAGALALGVTGLPGVPEVVLPPAAVPTALLYSTLGACAVLMGLVVYKYELYEHEPWYMLILVTLLGAGTMWAAGWTQGAIIRWLDEHPILQSNFFFAALAGSTEEIAKIAAVVCIVIVGRRHFNDPIDGIVYGSFAGLGAAILESVMVMGIPDSLMTLPGTEPVRLAGHLVMGGIGAAGLGALPAKRAVWWPVLVSLGAAIVLHSAWDVVAFDAADVSRDGKPRVMHTAAGVVLMLAGFVVFRWFVAIAVRHARRVFGKGE